MAILDPSILHFPDLSQDRLQRSFKAFPVVGTSFYGMKNFSTGPGMDAGSKPLIRITLHFDLNVMDFRTENFDLTFHLGNEVVHYTSSFEKKLLGYPKRWFQKYQCQVELSKIYFMLE
jgi:hypothetical protein